MEVKKEFHFPAILDGDSGSWFGGFLLGGSDFFVHLIGQGLSQTGGAGPQSNGDESGVVI